MSEVTKRWVEERRAALPGELLELIKREPGRTKTYYLFMRVEDGGLNGLSDDKYAALMNLIDDGLVEWGCNRGRVQKFKGLYPAGHPERDLPLRSEPKVPSVASLMKAQEEANLEKGLLRLVAEEPGRAESHYCRLPLQDGGIRGSQERKERAIKRLLEQGKLLRVDLPRAVGRKTYGVHTAESLARRGVEG